MKRALVLLLLLTVLSSLSACTPKAAPETTKAVFGTQSPETTGFASEEARLAQIRQEAEAFLKAHPDEMEALAARMLESHGAGVIYQFYPREEALYAYNSGDHIPQERLREHPILDAAGFLRGTELFDLLYADDWELGSPGCVFLKNLEDPGGHPLYWCELIRCPDASGDPADYSKAAIAVEEIAPGWYWYLEPTPDGPVIGASVD